MILGVAPDHWLVILSVPVLISGSVIYIRDTLRGDTQPNRVTWSMWASAPLIGAVAALAAHADIWTTIRIFLAGFLPLLVVLASFVNPKSYWRIGLFDAVCGLASLLALVVWFFAGSPRMAILLAAIGDAFAGLPTIRKAWSHPESETGYAYLASLAAALLVLPSIPVWNIENAAFQVYLMSLNATILTVIYRKNLARVFVSGNLSTT